VTLTATELLAAATDVLGKAGYKQVATRSSSGWPDRTSRLFEDSYGIVAVLVYETWSELAETWADAQAALVQTMSTYIRANEPKAWDGYLVLLTGGVSGDLVNSRADDIRRNTTRVRKLVGTGDEMRSLSDVEIVLLPLLPLDLGKTIANQAPILDLLPGILSRHGIPQDTSEVLIKAFRDQQPIMERLHQDARQQ
jgi:hypothetical protein